MGPLAIWWMIIVLNLDAVEFIGNCSEYRDRTVEINFFQCIQKFISDSLAMNINFFFL